MLLLCLFAACCTVPSASCAAGVVPVVAQDSLEEQVKAFKKLVGDNNQEVADQAIPQIDSFVQRSKKNAARLLEIADSLEIKEGDAKALKEEAKALEQEQELLAEAVWASFSRKRPSEANLRLWKSSAFAFGQMGAQGAPYLWKAFEDKRFNKDVEFRALCVEQVGHTRDYGQYKALLDLLDYKDEAVIAAAGNALAQFGEAPGAVRRESTEKLVKQLESYHNASTNYEDTNAIRIYRQVKGPLISALTAMTGQSFGDPLEWTKWWNDNKNDRAAWADKA